MKTTKIKNILFCSVLLGLFFVSCSKDGDQGPIGPAGPQGEQGIAGTAGADGTDGLQGETGTANVIYSDWIQAAFLNPNAAPENVMGLGTLSENEFDIGTDVMLVYGGNNINSASYEIFQLPYLHNQNINYGFGIFGDGNDNSLLQIRASTIDGSNNAFSFIDSYRYIVIPGGNPLSGKSSVIDYSKMSYEEVLAYFNIPE